MYCLVCTYIPRQESWEKINLAFILLVEGKKLLRPEIINIFTRTKVYVVFCTVLKARANVVEVVLYLLGLRVLWFYAKIDCIRVTDY